jgi:FkbM family methyltransferase
MIKELRRFVEQCLMGRFLTRFRGKGLANLVDVGSAGTLPNPWNRSPHLIRNLLRFEPRDEATNLPHVVTVNSALWEENCEKNFYIYRGRKGSGSSLFEQNYDYVIKHFNELQKRGPKELAETWFERSKLEDVERIACRTLDDVLEELGHPFSYHFLKIDAQGAEYPILRGAEKLLSGSCIGLHLELFVIPLYKGIKLLDEVQGYLRGFGFELLRKFPAHGSFDAQHDCLFLKANANPKIENSIRMLYGL